MRRFIVLLLTFIITLNISIVKYQPVKATGGVGSLTPVTDFNQKLQFVLTLLLMAGLKGASTAIEFASKDTVDRLTAAGKEVAYDLGTGSYKIAKDTIDFINTQVSTIKSNVGEWKSLNPQSLNLESNTYIGFTLIKGQEITFANPMTAYIEGTPYNNVVLVRWNSSTDKWEWKNTTGSLYQTYRYGNQFEAKSSIPTVVPMTSMPLSNTFKDADTIKYPSTAFPVSTDLEIKPKVGYTGGSVGSLTSVTDIGTLADAKPYTGDTSIPGDTTGDLDYNLPSDVTLNFAPLQVATQKFPFSIPWDLINIVKSFKADRSAPKWTVTFPAIYKLQSSTITIDFAPFDKVAIILRYFLLIIFVWFLASKTREII